MIKDTIIEEQMNPNLIPKITLYTGDKIPCIGLDIFGSDSVSHETVAAAVKKAIYSGYRHIDCASVYGNEKNIGNVFCELFSDGYIKREDIWITSKVWNDRHDNFINGKRKMRKSCSRI